MKLDDIKQGDVLYAIVDFSWLVKGTRYRVTEITEYGIVLEKGLHWPKRTVKDHFTVVVTD